MRGHSKEIGGVVGMIKVIELGNEAKIITKGTTPSTLGKDLVETGVPFLRAQNVIDGKVLIDKDILFIDNETHSRELKRSQIFPGDLLLTIAGTIGRTAIVSDKIKELNCNQAVAIIRLESKDIDKSYLKRYIETDFAQRQFNKGMVTATISNLSLAQVRKLKIPLPPLATQQRIAAILDAADTCRQHSKALIEKYDQLAQSLFLDMFGDPVTNPKRWEKKLLKYICTKITDGTHFSPEPQSKGFPYVTAKHVKDHGLDFYSKPTFISGDAHNEIYKRCTPEFGDILYIKDGATTGIACINTFKEPISLLSSLALLKLNSNYLNNRYLCYWLNHKGVKEKHISEFMSGAAIKRYTLKKINSFQVLLPPITLQNQFAARIEAIEAQKAQAQQSLAKSEELFNSLLQRAFKGDLG